MGVSSGERTFLNYPRDFLSPQAVAPAWNFDDKNLAEKFKNVHSPELTPVDFEKFKNVHSPELTPVDF